MARRQVRAIVIARTHDRYALIDFKQHLASPDHAENAAFAEVLA